MAMDGSDRVTVVHNNILWPNCLTIDYAADRLYWIDARYHVLETARLDGSQRQTLVDHGNCLLPSAHVAIVSALCCTLVF